MSPALRVKQSMKTGRQFPRKATHLPLRSPMPAVVAPVGCRLPSLLDSTTCSPSSLHFAATGRHMAQDKVSIASVNHTESEYSGVILRTQSTDFTRTVYYTVKRVFDVLLASVALVLLAPLMAIIAVAIKLNSPGPIIYRQERVGSRRRVVGDRARWETYSFTLYKFRTMRQEADTELHRAFVEAFIDGDVERMAALNGNEDNVRKLTADPRVTWVGKYLRHLSLDELPQFWNVVKGEMSLVGPRPPLSYEVEKYRAWHHLRFRAVPGLTGLWQVDGRSAVEFDEMIALDLLYIQRQSMWTDIKILFRTPAAVIRGRGAC